MDKTKNGGMGDCRGRQTGQRAAPRKGRRLGLILLVVCVLAVAVGLGVRAWIRMPEVPSPLPDSSVLGPSGQENEEFVGDRKAGVYTFLVAGKDVASGSTDVMLLLTYDTEEKTIFGLNLPRDTMINTTAGSKRLNAVYSANRGTNKDDRTQAGMTALKQAVQKQTGILPDFYVLVEWEAIGELVDALGGVEFEVPFDMDYDDPYQDPPLHIHQKAGVRTLTGDDAMQVIRWRKNNDGSGGEGGDIARLAIQQDFLKAVAKKCLQPATFLKINSLVEIFKENVATDLTVGNILAFAEQAVGLDPDTGVSFTTAPLADSFRYGGAALVTLNGEELLKIINENCSPYREDIELTDLELIVRGGDGYFSVTSGTLAEGINDKVTKPSTQPKPEPENVPAEPEQPEGEPPVEGETPEGEEPAEPTDPEQPGDTEPETPETEGEIEVPGQPDPILPDPETIPEQPAPQPEVQPEQSGEEHVETLPATPEPVEQAA